MSIDKSLGARPLDLTQDLTPLAIETFLRVSGWQQLDRHVGVSSIWELPEAEASLMLPYNAHFRDFDRRLRDALRTISEVYDIPNGETLALEIAGARNDIILLRADQLTFDGSIPLKEAQGLLNGARKMLLAAACSAIQPRSSFKGRKPGAALDFVSHEVRMGHTFRGSFVLTLIARHDVPSIEEESSNLESEIEEKSVALQHNFAEKGLPSTFSGEDETYTRRVTTTLATGLQAANGLLQDDPGMSMDDAIRDGASAELLGSLQEMGDHPGVRALDITFRWSPIQPAPAPGISNRVVVPRPDRDRLQAVRSSMLRHPVIPQQEILGQVIRLERSEGQNEGTVVIDGYVGKVRHRIKCSLEGDSYRLAIRAHEDQRAIVASGQIVVEKQSWWLRGPVAIRLPLAFEEAH